MIESFGTLSEKGATKDKIWELLENGVVTKTPKCRGKAKVCHNNSLGSIFIEIPIIEHL